MFFDFGKEAGNIEACSYKTDQGFTELIRHISVHDTASAVYLRYRADDLQFIHTDTEYKERGQRQFKECRDSGPVGI